MNGTDKIDGSELGKHPGMNHCEAEEWPGDFVLVCRRPTDPHLPQAATVALPAPAPRQLSPLGRLWGDTGVQPPPETVQQPPRRQPQQGQHQVYLYHPIPRQKSQPRGHIMMAMGDAGRDYCPHGPSWGAKCTSKLLRSKGCTQGCKAPPRDTSVLTLAGLRPK